MLVPGCCSTAAYRLQGFVLPSGARRLVGREFRTVCAVERKNIGIRVEKADTSTGSVIGVKGFWYHYSNIERLVDELGLQDVFTVRLLRSTLSKHYET